MPPKKNLSRGCLSNWCDADADEDADADAHADSSKTICRPPPYGGVDIITRRPRSILKHESFTVDDRCFSYYEVMYTLYSYSTVE